jgi:hypothetical protein
MAKEGLDWKALQLADRPHAQRVRYKAVWVEAQLHGGYFKKFVECNGGHW